jgi:uncharacterized protein
MHAPLPERIEVERAVATGRVYAGSVPLSAMPRLTSLLADARGEVRYQLKFGRNALHQKMVEMQAQAGLPLICQASLERFELPVQVEARLGFVRDESDEAGLPEGYEAALTDEGFVDPLALIEDELILAVPVIPRNPDVAMLEPAPAPELEADAKRPNPFAALAGLKRK